MQSTDKIILTIGQANCRITYNVSCMFFSSGWGLVLYNSFLRNYKTSLGNKKPMRDTL